MCEEIASYLSNRPKISDFGNRLICFDDMWTSSVILHSFNQSFVFKMTVPLHGIQHKGWQYTCNMNHIISHKIIKLVSR